MKRLLSITGIWAVTLGFMATALSPVALAATKPAAAPTTNSAKQGQALEIAPPVINLNANPGQTVTTRIYLRNISSGDLVVKGQANDFVAAGEDGTPKVLLQDTTNNPYSLKDWIATPQSLLLVPKEIKTMDITIRVPGNASPGGHYGVIRFTATPPSLKDTGVSLSASLGALILFTVNGKIDHNLSVKEFSVNHGGKSGSLFESGPVNFVEKIRNDGNVHEQPSGTVTVTNMFNKPVGGVNVNRPPRNILPGSVRKFEQALDKSVIGNTKLFGRYKAVMKVTYDGGKTLTATKTFWVIPYKLIAALAVLLVAGFFVVRALIRRYNRRVIEKAQRGGPHGPQQGPPPAPPSDSQNPAPPQPSQSQEPPQGQQDQAESQSQGQDEDQGPYPTA